MGIIKAFTGATGGVMADQWLEMYYCDSIPAGILAVRGQKRVSERSSNTKGNENVISDGSIIVVNEGQSAIAVEQGKIIGAYTQPGENVFHGGSASIFSGGGVKGIGKEIFNRVGFGGDVAIHQFILYIDMKEQLGNSIKITVMFWRRCSVLLKFPGVGALALSRVYRVISDRKARIQSFTSSGLSTFTL